MSLEKSMVSDSSQLQSTHTIWFHLHEMSKTRKSIETESGLVVAESRESWQEMGNEY